MLVSIKEYAHLCGLRDSSAIRKRIKSGSIVLTERRLPDNSIGKYIDTVKFPAIRLRKEGAGRKKTKSKRGGKNKIQKRKQD